MGHLVPSSWVLHGSQFLKLTFLFIEDPEVIQNNSSKVVLLLLSSTHVDFVQDLDRGELTRHLFHVANANLVSLLRSQLVDEHSTTLFIIVVEAGFL